RAWHVELVFGKDTFAIGQNAPIQHAVGTWRMDDLVRRALLDFLDDRFGQQFTEIPAVKIRFKHRHIDRADVAAEQQLVARSVPSTPGEAHGREQRETSGKRSWHAMLHGARDL